MSGSRASSTLLRRALAFGATAIVLAGVILGVSALAKRPASDAPQPEQSELTAAQRSRLAVLKGREALASGDMSAAVELFDEALKLDPANTEARQALASATASVDTAPDRRPDASAAEPDDAVRPSDPVFSTEIEDITLLLPASVSGFVLGSVSKGEQDVTVAGSPASSDIRASRALWTVHDRGSAKAAEAFVSSVSKHLYPKDAAEPVVDGAKAYFGTDGTRFATLVYVRGRYVFEVVLTAASGAPKSLLGEAKSAAAAFADGL